MKSKSKESKRKPADAKSASFGMLSCPDVNPPNEDGGCYGVVAGGGWKNKARFRLIGLGEYDGSNLLAALLCETCLKAELGEMSDPRSSDSETFATLVLPIQMTSEQIALIQDAMAELEERPE